MKPLPRLTDAEWSLVRSFPTGEYLRVYMSTQPEFYRANSKAGEERWRISTSIGTVLSAVAKGALEFRSEDLSRLNAPDWELRLYHTEFGRSELARYGAADPPPVDAPEVDTSRPPNFTMERT